MSVPVLRLLAAAALLGGCAATDTQPPAPAQISFDERARALRAVQNWEMRGRIAVATGTDEGSWQGRFTWWQEAESLRVVIRGPLNTRPVEITGDGSQLRVRIRRETRVLEDPEAELSELLGWWLPITSLPSWLLGLPDDRYTVDAFVADRALPNAIGQRAWDIQYADYELHGAASIPSAVRLAHAPLELVVTVDEWSPLRSDSP